MYFAGDLFSGDSELDFNGDGLLDYQDLFLWSIRWEIIVDISHPCPGSIGLEQAHGLP